MPDYPPLPDDAMAYRVVRNVDWFEDQNVRDGLKHTAFMRRLMVTGECEDSLSVLINKRQHPDCDQRNKRLNKSFGMNAATAGEVRDIIPQNGAALDVVQDEDDHACIAVPHPVEMPDLARWVAGQLLSKFTQVINREICRRAD